MGGVSSDNMNQDLAQFGSTEEAVLKNKDLKQALGDKNRKPKQILEDTPEETEFNFVGQKKLHPSYR